MDRWRALKAFVSVVEARSYTAAAGQLGVSRSNLSKQISALEESLGLRLLNRSTKHVSTTDLGAQYYATSRRLLAEFDEAEFNLKSSQRTARGRIKLLAPKSLAVLALVDALRTFSKQHPEVEVSVVLEDALMDLVENGFDLALRFGWQPDSSLIAKKVGAFAFICCATPGYLRRHGVPAKPADLSSHQCLRHTSTASDSGWRFKGERGEIAVPVSGPVLANSTVFLRECLLRGDGIGLMPSFSVRKDIARGRLRPLLTRYRTEELPLYVVYPARQHLATKVRLCVDFLDHWFRRSGAAGES